MKIKLFFLTALFTVSVNSQVGIGTTNPHPSAALEINSQQSGLLIPRVSLNSLTDVTTIPNPANSLLIYNTSTTGGLSRGFYFWQDNTWNPFKETTSGSGNNGNAWLLNGNSSNATNFLGTTNFFPINFRVDNRQFGFFHPNGGITLGFNSSANINNSLAIGTNANASSSTQAVAIGNNATGSGFQSLALGVSSRASNNSTVAIGTNSQSASFQAVAIGVNANALNNNTIALGFSSEARGFQAVAIGVEAKAFNNNTIALGVSSEARGFQSYSIGVGSKSDNNSALAIGTSANANGLNTTALGAESSATAQNAIGYQASATQSNSIILGNSSNGSNRVGIGTNTPDERLHINGSIKIVDGNQAAGRVLTSDATGKATWVTPTTANTAFANIYSNEERIIPNGNSNVSFGAANASSNVTINSNNSFTVQTTGSYKIMYNLSLRSNSNGPAKFIFNLFSGNTLIPGSLTSVRVESGDISSVFGSVIVMLNANQTVSLRTEANYSQNGGGNGNGNSVFLLNNGCSLSIEQLN